MAFLELKNINYKYPTSEDWVVRNIDIKIEKGEFWAIIGKNGSGKTTLCNIMRGFAPSFFKGTFEGEVIVYFKMPSSKSDAATTMLHDSNATMSNKECSFCFIIIFISL